MPVKQWLTSILAIAVTVIGAASANAQFSPFDAQPSASFAPPPVHQAAFGPPPGAMMPGGPIQHAGYMQPGMPSGPQAGAPHGGIPDNFGTWPTISPFENRFSEFRNENGLWVNEVNNDRRKYFAGLGAMLFWLSPPERTLFGDENAFHALQGFINLGAIGSRDVYPIGGRSDVSSEEVFNEPFTTEGIRANWGFWDADGTGLELIGWWASETNYDFEVGEGFIRNGVPTAGPTVPVLQPDNGSIFLFFDASFKLTYRVMMVNGQINRMLRPIWQWGDGVVIRPMWAARYNYIGEELDFAGTGTGGGLAAPFGTVGQFAPARIHNEIASHLAGPAVGLHTEIGGDILKVTLGSQFILYVNHERHYVDGFGFGLAQQRTGAAGIFNPNDPGFGQAFFTSIEASRFRETRKTTHLSPAFEQTVHFEAHVFRLLPWINKMQFFHNAKLRGGLTYLDIGNVARPAESIKYKALPLTPQIQTSRSKFSAFAWDIGLHFKY